MTAAHPLSAAALVAAVAAGTCADRTTSPPHREIHGYQVLTADFHVHMLPFGWAELLPCATVDEAGRQGLDIVALTPHNEVWPAKLGRWCSTHFGGPLVIVGEEITAPNYHMIAVGIERAVPNDLPAARAIDEIHDQNGIAIAAHPYHDSWPAYDAVAVGRLDASEIVRPESALDPRLANELAAFLARAPMTPIGSSDYHGLAPIGWTRTYIFVRARSSAAVIEALREHRTVVSDGRRTFGDPVLVRLAAEHGLPDPLQPLPRADTAQLISRVLGLSTLAALLLFRGWTFRPITSGERESCHVAIAE